MSYVVLYSLIMDGAVHSQGPFNSWGEASQRVLDMDKKFELQLDWSTILPVFDLKKELKSEGQDSDKTLEAEETGSQ